MTNVLIVMVLVLNLLVISIHVLDVMVEVLLLHKLNLFLEQCSKSKEDNMAGLDSTVLTVVAGLFGIVAVVGFMATKIYK